MRFRFYVTDLFEGQIIGTDDPKVAADFAKSEEHFVVDTETGKWLTSDGKKRDIKSA